MTVNRTVKEHGDGVPRNGERTGTSRSLAAVEELDSCALPQISVCKALASNSNAVCAKRPAS